MTELTLDQLRTLRELATNEAERLNDMGEYPGDLRDIVQVLEAIIEEKEGWGGATKR